MPLYTVNSDTTLPSNISITQNSPDAAGPRLTLDVNGFPDAVKTGQVGHVDANGIGLFTVGQFQCMCLIVVKMNGDAWGGAWLAHVSHARHSKVAEILGHVDNTCYAAVASRSGMRDAVADLAQHFLDRGAKRVWQYLGRSGNEGLGVFSGFGIRNDGVMGEP